MAELVLFRISTVLIRRGHVGVPQLWNPCVNYLTLTLHPAKMNGKNHAHNHILKFLFAWNDIKCK